MGRYERAVERFARTPVGYWYVTRMAPRIDPPLLRITAGGAAQRAVHGTIPLIRLRR